MGIFDSIKKIMKEAEPSADRLALALADARKVAATSHSECERLDAALRVQLTGTDEARAKTRQALADARERAEDADLFVANLQARHDEALVGEEEQRRLAAYHAAQAMAQAAAKALTKDYGDVIKRALEMMKALAEAQSVVVSANAQLPDGAVPLDDPEMLARAVPGLPREIVADEEVVLWGRLDLHTPADDQVSVYDCGGGWGRRPGDEEAAFRLRRFRKVTYREAVVGDFPMPLAAALQLPSLSGSGMAWGDAYPVFTPGLGIAVIGQENHDAVLGRLAEIDATATAKPVKALRPLKVEWVSHADVVPLPPAKVDNSPSLRVLGSGSRFGASPFAAPGARARGRR